MTGQRSQLVAAKLKRAGFAVFNLRGGLVDWQAQGLSLDRRALSITGSPGDEVAP